MAALSRFDAAEYLDDPESIAGYLESALEEGDPGNFLEALGVVARAKGMTELAKNAGVTRPALYRSISATGHPHLNTVLSVMKSLGVSLHVVPAQPATTRELEDT